MSGNETRPPGRHRHLWRNLVIGVSLLVLALGLGWYLNSRHFQNVVRRHVVTALEQATGGKVELSSLHWNLSRLEIEGNDLTIRGKEQQNELPFVHVDRIYARLHIVSLVETKMTLRELDLDRPEVHVDVYPDGSTSAPDMPRTSTSNPVQQLFDLAVGHAVLRNGTLLLSERRLPLDFAVNDLEAGMNYVPRERRYDGIVRAGKMNARYQDWREFAVQGLLDFSLWENRAEVNRFQLVSQKSSLEASGKLTDFNHPHLEFKYTGDLDLGQVGAIVRAYGLRSGALTVSGEVKSREAEFSSGGKLALKDFDYIAEGLNLRHASFNSSYAVDRDRLQLTRMVARVFGGDVTGDAEVKNYASPTAPETVQAASGNTKLPRSKAASNEAKITGPGPQQGRAHLRVNGLSVPELARAFSTRSLPVDKLNPAGTASGSVELAWLGSLNRATADIDASVVPPASPADEQMPVTATLRGHYSAARAMLEIVTLELATRHTHLTASGPLGSRTAELKVNAGTTSLTELQPVIMAFGGGRVPLELAGQASFDGTVSGKLRQPQIAGHVQATDFNYLYQAAPAAAPQPVAAAQKQSSSWFHHAAPAPAPQASPAPVLPRRIHIDSFAGDLQYSDTNLALRHGVIQQDGAQLGLDGSLALQKGAFTETSPFEVEASIHNASLTDLQRLGGVSYPVSGVLNASLKASGTQANPSGSGRISLASADVYGRQVQSFSANLLFANHEAQLNDIHLKALRGTVQGSAAYNLSTKAGHFELVGESVDLEQLPELQAPRFQTAGVADFTVRGSGTLDQPSINAHVQIDHLVLNGEREGDLAIDAVTQGREMKLTARSKFPKATLALDGTVGLHHDFPADLTLQFENLDIDPFLTAETRATITEHSAMAGVAKVSGPLKLPRELNGNLRLDAFNLEIEKVPLHSDGVAELSLTNQVVSVRRFVVLSGDSRFSLSGTVDLNGDRALNLQGLGRVNLKLAQTIDSDIRSSGTADVDIRIAGTMTQPVMTGRMAVEKAGFTMVDLPAGLSDLTGTLLFNQNRLVVEKLTGHAGGGLVDFTGFVTFGKTIGFDLTANGRDIRFRYSGVSVTSDQELHLAGTLQSANLTGDITVTRFAQIPTADFMQAMATSRVPAEAPNPQSLLNNLHLDIRILSSSELTVQTSLAKLSGDVDLRLRGTPLRPVLLGRINVAQGDIKLNGTKYYLERGDITFADPVRIDPILDVEATTHVRDYDITIGLHGTLEKLNTTYRSDPPLSSDDIVSLLAFGRTQQESASGGGATLPNMGFAESASNAILGQAINSAVTNRVSKLFGVSSIRINPSVGGPENDPNARLTVEQQVSNNITITYITNLAQSAQQVIQFEYNINPQYTIVATRDENGVFSVDFLVRQRRR